jgi:transcriptional regulator with XRE-family HTH domain
MPISMKITPLKLRRLQKELKQSDVAKAIGMSQQRYSQIEREEVTPNQSERNKLKVIFEVDDG